ncbi:hypothetical protein CERSUDRAFT_126421 [Gelatoporia subvermispora B]|uniref:CFEM domain-containing protein n=1 Tax=Ceriporiopsis subvermispora (strain B) TaxID=914234 RepID=M2R1Z7_CERS8|nr:hypothetical protein CERSUDRAFT_126421 [Gelatoporia subvermispora B]
MAYQLPRSLLLLAVLTLGGTFVAAQASLIPPPATSASSSSSVSGSSASGSGTLASSSGSGSITASASGSSSISASPTSTASFPSLSGFSSCVDNCLSLAVSDANCTSVVDVQCFCANTTSFTQGLVSCISPQCISDLPSAEALAQSFCALASPSVSLSFPAPSPNATSSSHASSSSGASSSASSSSVSVATVSVTMTTGAPNPSTSTNAAPVVLGGQVGWTTLGAMGTLLGALMVL